MLLYNHKQEFIGINDEGLRILNYSSLDELLSVCSDVADLFSDEPGYIHNFKNFGWINFLLHADSDASNAIVNGNGRAFSCKLTVNKIYLRENPSQNGFTVEMSQIKTLNGTEFKPRAMAENISIQGHTPQHPFNSESTVASHPPRTQIVPPTVLDVPTPPAHQDFSPKEVFQAPPSTEEIYTSSFREPEKNPSEAVMDTPVVAVAPRPSRYTSEEKEYLSHHKVAKDYVFDPHVAASELGLPVDLIEEFIGDFIQQSFEFKENLFDAVSKADFTNLHILSHKLKGVAANLRIEDALEVLTIINTSVELTEVEANLKYYYEVIAKLSGEPLVEESEELMVTTPTIQSIAQQEPSFTPPPLTKTEEIYAFGIKNHNEASPLVQEREDNYQKEFFDTNIGTIERPVLHYNSRQASEELGMEESFFNELLLDYKNDAHTISNEIAQAIVAFDSNVWRKSAAKLHGISENLRLIEISEELALLSQTNDAQEAKKASSRLNSYLDQL